jgi:hypothetical protein
MYELIMDTESQDFPNNKKPKKTGFARAWKVPLPLRRSHILSDIVKIAFCLTLAAYVLMTTFFISAADKCGTDALARSIISKSSMRVRFGSQTTTSTTGSASLLLGKALFYGRTSTRTLSIMPIQCQYIRTTTILVASHFLKPWLPGVSVLKLIYI